MVYHKTNKMIFLDIDGVLATITQYNLTQNSKSWVKKYNVYPFDKKCVKVLNEIIENIDVEIVISSDWRQYYTIEELGDIFQINGIIKKPIDVTEMFSTSSIGLEKNRALEILSYVEKNKINNWIAIDDLDMSHWLKNKFVLCGRVNEGIKQSGLKEKIIKKLWDN